MLLLIDKQTAALRQGQAIAGFNMHEVNLVLLLEKGILGSYSPLVSLPKELQQGITRGGSVLPMEFRRKQTTTQTA